MVFKKDLTPIGKGGITKHRGKGAVEQRVPRGMPDSVTGPPGIDRMMNRYPKARPPESPAMGPMPPDEE